MQKSQSKKYVFLVIVFDVLAIVCSIFFDIHFDKISQDEIDKAAFYMFGASIVGLFGTFLSINSCCISIFHMKYDIRKFVATICFIFSLITLGVVLALMIGIVFYRVKV